MIQQGQSNVGIIQRNVSCRQLSLAAMLGNELCPHLHTHIISCMAKPMAVADVQARLYFLSAGQIVLLYTCTQMHCSEQPSEIQCYLRQPLLSTIL